VTLVIIGAPTPERVEESVAAFVAGGFQRIDRLDGAGEGDLILGVDEGGAELLREADRRGINYVLIHDGDDDGREGGSYQRAHYRIDAGRREELVEHLRSRRRPLVTCLAFGYKNGAPADAALVVDVRFLDNPYWVPELRNLSGRDTAVSDYVMRQPAAGRILDDVTRMVRDFLPHYLRDGRKHVVVAFGCSGGRHRSVVLAANLARRLGEIEGIDVDFVARDIE
jgi:rhodanese/phosphatase family RapZ-like protein